MKRLLLTKINENKIKWFISPFEAADQSQHLITLNKNTLKILTSGIQISITVARFCKFRMSLVCLQSNLLK